MNKSQSFEDAAEWDVRQQVSMSPQARHRASRDLSARVYPDPQKDVRESHQKP